MEKVREFFSDPVRKFGVVDIVFALMYLAVFLFLIPPHTIPAETFAWGLPVLLLGAGIFMLTGRPFAKRIAVWVAAGFLAFTVFLVAALLWTAGYLQGVYGQMGKGFSLLTLLAAAVVVEFVGLWPYFQLRAMADADDEREQRVNISPDKEESAHSDDGSMEDEGKEE